jgi:hypothetical protein
MNTPQVINMSGCRAERKADPGLKVVKEIDAK